MPGFRFRARLPARKASSLAPPQANGETILVLEDEEIVRRFAAEALSGAGYRVLQAGDGRSGIECLRACPDIAMLFTDVVLTGPMNGRNVADAARELRSGLKILFTTGYTPNAIIHHGRLDEGINFIGKPFTAATLTAKVRALPDGDQLSDV